MSRQREVEILQAMAKADLPEQRRLAQELEDLVQASGAEPEAQAVTCGAVHPEQPGVTCLAKRSHDQHFALHAGTPVEWPNADWVEPPPRTRSSKGKAAERLKSLADQVPPRRSVDTNVLDIGATHPDTSEQMRDRKVGKTGTQRRLIYDLALTLGDHGVTDDEVEQRLGLLHQSASAARNSLMKDGWLIDSGARRKTRSREDAIVWVARPGG